MANNSETTSSKPRHPGTIVFIDGVTQQIRKEVPANEVAEDIRYCETDDGYVPVVEIVDYATEDRIIIRQYGPDGELLQSTVMIP